MNLMLGYLIGTHLLSTGLNDHHPLLEINDSVMIYENSFERTSVAGFKKFELGNVKLRLGLTSGYNNVIHYKGRTYRVATATEDGVGLFVVPSYEKNGFIVAIVGDSINAGVAVKF